MFPPDLAFSSFLDAGAADRLDDLALGYDVD
jgi:hypothetical protein